MAAPGQLLNVLGVFRSIGKTCFFRIASKRQKIGSNKSAVPCRGAKRVRLRMKSAKYGLKSAPLPPAFPKNCPLVAKGSIWGAFSTAPNLDQIAVFSNPFYCNQWLPDLCHLEAQTHGCLASSPTAPINLTSSIFEVKSDFLNFLSFALFPNPPFTACFTLPP